MVQQSKSIIYGGVPSRVTASIGNRNVVLDDFPDETLSTPRYSIEQASFRFRMLGLNSQQAFTGGVQAAHLSKVDDLLDSLAFR